MDDSEDNLQRGTCKFHSMAKTSITEILPEISETIIFLGEDLVRCKIVEDNKC